MSRPGSVTPTLDRERQLWESGALHIAGVDEVGRGPLAGAVVAAAVVLRPWSEPIAGVRDSKRLLAAARIELDRAIRAQALAVAVGAASPREIDRLNIRRATALAMWRAVARLSVPLDHLLVDGLPVPELGAERQTAVVGGDRSVYSIACASIVAKVCRDRLMERLGPRHPEFGWARNAGYPTPEHLAALTRVGHTPHHRLSFGPVRRQHSSDTSQGPAQGNEEPGSA